MPTIPKALARYRELLVAANPEAVAAQLAEGMKSGHMTYKTRGICQVLRPFFLSRFDYERLLDRSRHVVSALKKVAAAMKKNPATLDRVGFTNDEKELIAIDGGLAHHDQIGRMDSFLQPDGSPRFLEYNGESPGGVAFGDALGDLFERLPFWKNFADEFSPTRRPAMPEVVDGFKSQYIAWAARKDMTPKDHPNVAIVDVPGVATVGEFHLFAKIFEKKGMPCRVVTTSDLRMEGHDLYAGDFKIDIVYRRLVTQDLLAALSTDHVIVRAMRQSSAFIANGFEGYFYSNKGLFAFISDPDLRPSTITPAEIDAVQASIPWTRLVGEGKTTPPDASEGHTEDLRSVLTRLQKRLVLKPTTGYGGQSVILGWTQTPGDWQRAIDDAYARPTVVQEKVLIPTQSFPAWRDGRLVDLDLQFDVDPYIISGTRTYGLGIRLSDGELLNVAAGSGSAVPGFILG